MSSRRAEACLALIAQARVILNAEGTGEATLGKIKALLMPLANQGEALFPIPDFALQIAQGRNHILALEDSDGMGLYLTIGLPDKQAAPHDHGIWCINAAISGQELHRFYRRTDDGTRDGYATVEETEQVLVAPG